MLVVALLLAMSPAPALASSQWGSATYGDPPGWCTRYSDMWTASVVTNDPTVAMNPERETFYGFHRDPGYDDWYGFFYGDFRGSPGDTSGWVKLLHEWYPQHYHWNFADFGWAVHGHVKQYIAYYNWTFGGQCGLGRYGYTSPPPFMADQFGWPVVDIYVDAMPPYDPMPRVMTATASSVTFTWDPVSDRGDGAGQDFFEAGMDHYTSWATAGADPNRLQLASTASPRVITQPLSAHQVACVHVQAFDRVGNASAERVVCAQAFSPPPMPSWSVSSVVRADPPAPGLAGLDTWLWLAPTPVPMVVNEAVGGVQYAITATPVDASWDFGDGALERVRRQNAFGIAFPDESSVIHAFQADSRAGYRITASIGYEVTYEALEGASWLGPYPMGEVTLPAGALTYPVRQAQPELVAVG
jgi:hypothetical protein